MCHHLTFMTFCWTTLQLMQIILVVTNAKYRSAEIQNELIHMAANQSQESICRQATEVTMIAFMVTTIIELPADVPLLLVKTED